MLFYGKRSNINKGSKSLGRESLPWSLEQYLMVSFISFLRLLFFLVVLGLSPFRLFIHF